MISQTLRMTQVMNELEKFEKYWDTKLIPEDSIYGIKSILDWINLDYGGMEKVKSAYENQDWVSAEKDLYEYFKEKRNHVIEQLVIEGEALKIANDALVHIIKGNKSYPPAFRGIKFDWNSKAEINGQLIHDKEWLYQFYRLQWWLSLAKIYQETEDERYFFEWRYELITFIEDCLPITLETPWAIRRGMETYYRCLCYGLILPIFIQSDNFDSKTLLLFLGSFHEQAEHIRTVYSTSGNHLLGELVQVLKNAIFFPEFKKSEEWLAESLSRIPELMHEMIFSDGMNKELVFSYHTMYIQLFFEFYQLVQKHGFENRLPKDFEKILRNMHDVMIYAIFPDLSPPQFGDAWKFLETDDHRFVPRYNRVLKSFPIHYPDVAYYRFIASHFIEGEPPPITSIAFPESGFYIMRSEWTPDAVYLILKSTAGQAKWHNQPDNGTFSLFAFGRNFMVDSGSYIYESSNEEDRHFREFFRKTSSHQTLTLNLQNTDCKPELLYWNSNEEMTVLALENQNYTNLKHRRIVIFLDQKYFVIYDEALGNAKGTLRAHFQLVPAPFSITTDGLGVVTDFPDGPNLLVRGFPQHPNLKMEEEEGWISYTYAKKEPRPAWSYALEKKTQDEKLSFLTILAPYRENADMPQINAEIQANKLKLTIDNKDYHLPLVYTREEFQSIEKEQVCQR